MNISQSQKPISQAEKNMLVSAAEAAGYAIRYDLSINHGIVLEDGQYWNPLQNKEQLFELETDLKISVHHYDDTVMVTSSGVSRALTRKYADDVEKFKIRSSITVELASLLPKKE